MNPRIRLTSAKVEVWVEVESELGNIPNMDKCHKDEMRGSQDFDYFFYCTDFIQAKAVVIM